LCRLGSDGVGVIVYVLEPAAATPTAFRIKAILKDRAQPRQHVCAGLEQHDVCACPQQRVLNKIVGLVAVPTEGNGEGAEPRHRGQHGCSHSWLKSHSVVSRLKRLRELETAVRPVIREIGFVV
jgi:hypothetical protein